MIRRAASILAAVYLASAFVVAGPALGRTVVSLEFDHATSDQLAGIALAAAHGMPVTVFALSGRIAEPGYMTVAQLRALQSAGDEIAGHTIDHQDLSKLSRDEQAKEICGDRFALESDGLDVTDFAYPYGHFGAATAGIVRRCGYQSARGTGGIESQGGCQVCLYAETIPPLTAFDTRTADSVLDTTRLVTIEGYVRHAESAGGGWLQIVFHHVCDRCDQYAVTAPTLAAFLAWLSPRSARGTVVETVRQVINTPFRPGPIAVLAGSAGVRVLADRRCPATPLTAACTSIPGRPSAAIRGAATLRLVTSATALRVKLQGARSGPVTGRRVRGGGVHHGRAVWRLRLSPSLRGTATITVVYPLGAASYPVRLKAARPIRRS